MILAHTIVVVCLDYCKGFFLILLLPFPILPITRWILLKWILLDNVTVLWKTPLWLSTSFQAHVKVFTMISKTHTPGAFLSTVMSLAAWVTLHSHKVPAPLTSLLYFNYTSQDRPFTQAAVSIQNVCPTDFCKVGLFTSFNVFSQMVLFPHPT